MDYLPPLAEQGRLIQDLAALVRSQGCARLVSAPLIEPRSSYFPELWRPDALGVERLARRLLVYAGLGELTASIELFEGDVQVQKIDASGHASAWSHQGAAAWFAGIVEGRCVFGANAHKLGDPDLLAGIMAHEVSHAFRLYHHLDVRDRETEEKLTDLTTIFLGFGLLSTNAAYRYRASGEIQGPRALTQWSHERGGYLSPQSMSFLLAVQVVLRDCDQAERRRIAGQLETNQATYFRAACESLDRARLIDHLGLPPPAEWPTVTLDIPGSYERPDDPPLADPVQEEQRALRQRYNGLPTFRVRVDRADRYTFFSAAAGIGGAIALSGTLGDVGAAALVLASLAFGRWLGKRTCHDRCSEPDCAWTISPTASTCPGCGGTISGRIAHEHQRLEAREALEEDDETQDKDCAPEVADKR